jgi:hypothetical protein
MIGASAVYDKLGGPYFASLGVDFACFSERIALFDWFLVSSITNSK